MAAQPERKFGNQVACSTVKVYDVKWMYSLNNRQ